ncbi:hypothetical protein [Marinobacter persicus]|nr:hypothetical protein [Marinobacter persicus]
MKRAPALMSALILAGAVADMARAADPLVLQVFTEARSTIVASHRLQNYLEGAKCVANLLFNGKPRGELIFRAGNTEGTLLLSAVNRDGEHPVPVWVTRKTAGVGSLSELQGRDVSMVAGDDPLAGALALEALAAEGVSPEPGQIYEAGDFSSALGLLLHNNTHAAVSELGLVRPMLETQGMVVTWQGEPVSGAGWYAPAPLPESTNTRACLNALARIHRLDDRQIFRIFPEWVSGFRPPESNDVEESRS